jgi:Ca-activated chloride channel family protein
MKNPPPRQGGFKLLNLLVLSIMIGVVYAFLSDGGNPGDAKPQNRSRSGAPAYAMTLKDNWPPMAKQSGAIADSADMTTANYYLILDGSGSMTDQQCSQKRRKIEVAVEAISAFARALPKDSNFGLAAFVNSKNRELAPLGKQHEAGLQGLYQIKPSGNTPLFNAVKFAYNKLTKQALSQLGYGEYHLVVVTDGMHSQGQDPTPMVDKIIGQSPVVIHTIGFCIDDDHALNQPGRTYYRSATDPASLKQGLEAVLAESPDFNVDRFEQ